MGKGTTGINSMFNIFLKMYFYLLGFGFYHPKAKTISVS